jgi:hypothetical protein
MQMQPGSRIAIEEGSEQGQHFADGAEIADYDAEFALLEATEISGIERAGLVRADPDRHLVPVQNVVAFMGGMERGINGSYVELTSVPAGNVLAVKTELARDELAAIPESCATAWAALSGNLDLRAGQTIVIRGTTSGVGQAALNIAAHPAPASLPRRATQSAPRRSRRWAPARLCGNCQTCRSTCVTGTRKASMRCWS